MKLTDKMVTTATVDTITGDMLHAVAARQVKAYGQTKRLCELALDLFEIDESRGWELMRETVAACGVGGEGTPAYKANSVIKSTIGRIVSADGYQRDVRPVWKRSADAVMTDYHMEAIKPKTPNESGNTGEGGEGGAPQHVEETPKAWTVARLVDHVMDNKPKRTKVSSVIIGLIAYLGEAGIAEVMAACQKAGDKLESEKTETQQAA